MDKKSMAGTKKPGGTPKGGGSSATKPGNKK